MLDATKDLLARFVDRHGNLGNCCQLSTQARIEMVADLRRLVSYLERGDDASQRLPKDKRIT